MDEDIKKELIELKFNLNSIGVHYWIEAIRIVKRNPNKKCKTMKIYEEIAKKYMTTVIAVDAAMRAALAPAKYKIQKKYKYYDKVKNSTFLELIRIKMI